MIEKRYCFLRDLLHDRGMIGSESRPGLKFCLHCRMAVAACYCDGIRPFESGPKIAVLVHPKEARKRIGTNRMVQLGISNSLRIEGTGEGLERNPEIEALIQEPSYYPTVLYPGPRAIDLDRFADPSAASTLVPPGKRLLVFVIDGTWVLAQQMIHRSPRLRSLPQLMFHPESLSNYRIRKQPGRICLSTVEAVHALLARLHRLGVYPIPRDESTGALMHHGLLEIFERMVNRQIECELLKSAARPEPLEP